VHYLMVKNPASSSFSVLPRMSRDLIIQRGLEDLRQAPQRVFAGLGSGQNVKIVQKPAQLAERVGSGLWLLAAKTARSSTNEHPSGFRVQPAAQSDPPAISHPVQ
jgi:hypothetical protein